MNDNTKKCPMCAEMIPVEAATCEYCGAEFQVTITGYCTNCHEVREADEKGHCKQCGSEVADKHIESKFVEEAAAQTVQPLPTTAAAPRAKQNKAWIWALAGTLILAVVIGLGMRIALGYISIPGLNSEERTVLVYVPANTIWADTGVEVRKGHTVNIAASGSVSTWAGHPEGYIPDPTGNGDPCTFDAIGDKCLLPYYSYGALIGQISSSGPFYVGKSFTTTADESGTLYLAINDNISWYEDNEGSFTATITVR
jgi:RNA polymerase subunit RPABC4/transcription elongation factor Spt4